MNTEQTRERLIYEQAARWHAVMQKQPSAQEREAFDQWLLESQRHIRCYLLVTAMDRELTRMDPQRQLAVEPLVAGIAQSTVVELQCPPASLASTVPALPATSATSVAFTALTRRRELRRWAAVACAAAVAAVTVSLKQWDRPGRYATATGEQRIIKLDDGSVMYLNTRSHARVHYSATTRSIELASGEASFVVARDTSRPFLVTAGATTIQAIGTEFNVYRHGSETAVAVIEGRVRVLTHERPLPLNAGEEANVATDGKVTTRKTAGVATAVAWRERRLVFRESPLSEIVAEFNRYNETPRLRVEATATAARRYSGIFDAYDPSSLAQVLSADGTLSVDRDGSEIVIREPAPH